MAWPAEAPHGLSREQIKTISDVLTQMMAQLPEPRERGFHGMRPRPTTREWLAAGRPGIIVPGDRRMPKPIQRDHRLLTRIRLDNLLSFGPESPALPMEKLNVLIGPNGSGKSNLIEAIALMRAAHGDFRDVLMEGGGFAEWIWKGNRKGQATVDFVVRPPKGKVPLRHLLAFRADGRLVFQLEDERIEDGSEGADQTEPYFCYQNGQPVVRTPAKRRQKLDKETFNRSRSVLSQLRHPAAYHELYSLGSAYEKIRIYREWTFGRATVFRQPQMADLPSDRLEEDFSNLGLFVNRLRQDPHAKAAVLEGMRDLYEGVSDYDVRVVGGTIQVVFIEGKFTIPATRLSDGTLRYLCLLAILLDPTPPPLICIEEPELGLHPDILPKLADHLVAASQRAQIIVTTHSDILVDAMTERPEAVVVCEKHEGSTHMRRLRRDDLAAWLDKYRLGQLWTKGQLGGTRW